AGQAAAGRLGPAQGDRPLDAARRRPPRSHGRGSGRRRRGRRRGRRRRQGAGAPHGSGGARRAPGAESHAGAVRSRTSRHAAGAAEPAREPDRQESARPRAAATTRRPVATDVMPPERSPPDDDAKQLLVYRFRAGLGLVLVAVVVFALTDARVHPESFRELYRLDALEFGVVLAAFWLVGIAATELQVIVVALVAVSVLCCVTAVAGVVANDAATAPLLLLVLTLG